MRRLKIKTFTFEKHKVYGTWLKRVYGILLMEQCEVCNTYGQSSRECKAARKATEGVTSLRYTLDDAVCRENPELSNTEVIGCYYGARETLPDKNNHLIIQVKVFLWCSDIRKL